MSGVVGYGVGYLMKQWSIRYRANEDLAVWDYVRMHPEDFPEIERKIASELLAPLCPLFFAVADIEF